MLCEGVAPSIVGAKEARGTDRTDRIDPDGSDRRPGERVGRWFILIELPLNHVVAQRIGGNEYTAGRN